MSIHTCRLELLRERSQPAGSGSCFEHRIERAAIVGHVFLSGRVRYPLAIDNELVLVLSRRDGDRGLPPSIFMPSHGGCAERPAIEIATDEYLLRIRLTKSEVYGDRLGDFWLGGLRDRR